jgi:hypothetical protein
MKTVLEFAMVLIVLATVAPGAEEPQQEGGAKTGIARFYYAKVTDRSGEDEYRVLSQDELNTMQEEISAESRCYARALIAAESEWKKNEDTKKKTFPRSAVKPKKVQVLQSFNDRAAADKKLQSVMERDMERAERDRDRPRSGGPQRSKPQQTADARREADRAALDERARSIFEGKLAEMISGTKKTDEAEPDGK